MASIKLYNFENQSEFIENVEAEMKKDGREFIYEFQLTKEEFMRIFESGYECKVQDGAYRDCEIIDEPKPMGLDSYFVRIVTVTAGIDDGE